MINSETWEKAKPLIDKALKYQSGHDIEDIKQAIEDNMAQLWCGNKSVIVTEIITYPKKKECRIWLASGDMQELTKEMLPDVESWAKGGGCQTVSVVGRKGWLRVLKDYFQPHIVIEKELL